MLGHKFDIDSPFWRFITFEAYEKAYAILRPDLYLIACKHRDFWQTQTRIQNARYVGEKKFIDFLCNKFPLWEHLSHKVPITPVDDSMGRNAN